MPRSSNGPSGRPWPSNYPRDRLKIWLLDDGKRPWLRDLCGRYGVGCVVRPTNEHGKAGNLNYALPRTTRRLLVGDRRRLRTRPAIPPPDVRLPDVPATTSGWCRRRNTSATRTRCSTTCSAGRAWTEEQYFFMTMAQSARDSYEQRLLRRQRVDRARGRGWPNSAASRSRRSAKTLKSPTRSRPAGGEPCS